MSPGEKNGSKLIYTKVISPFVMKHEEKIDEAMVKATDAASNALESVQNEGKLNSFIHNRASFSCPLRGQLPVLLGKTFSLVLASPSYAMSGLVL